MYEPAKGRSIKKSTKSMKNKVKGKRTRQGRAGKKISFLLRPSRGIRKGGGPTPPPGEFACEVRKKKKKKR